MNIIQTDNLTRKGAGRPAGSKNKTTKLLKEAVIRAAELEGTALAKDGDDGGLVSYCRFLAREEPKAFSQLLGKLIPLQMTGEDGGPVYVITGVPRAGDEAV